MRKSNKTINNVSSWEQPTHCWDINASRLFHIFGLRLSHVRHWFHTTTYHSTKSSRLIFEMERPPLYNSFLLFFLRRETQKTLNFCYYRHLSEQTLTIHCNLIGTMSLNHARRLHQIILYLPCFLRHSWFIDLNSTVVLSLYILPS